MVVYITKNNWALKIQPRCNIGTGHEGLGLQVCTFFVFGLIESTEISLN